MPAELTTFADLLHPFPEDRFFAEVHDRQPLHIRAESPDKFAEVMNWGILSRILNMTAIWSPESLQLVLDRETIPPAAYCREAIDRTNKEALQPDAEKVKSMLRRGASLIANDIDTLTPGVARAANILEQALGGKTQSNLYCSWRQRQAFDTHFDTHEVFALHVEGEKTWRIYQGQLDRPVAHPMYKTLSKAYHDSNKGAVRMEVTLRPGDLLYIPRGFYHDALASSQGTVHVAFGVTHVIGLDILNILLAHAVADPAFRTNFPLPQAGEEGTRQHLSQLIERMKQLAESTPVTDDVLRFRREYYYPRGGFNLPADAEPTAYGIAQKGLRLSERDGRPTIETGAGTLVVPPGSVHVVEWILAQDTFAPSGLEQAFPDASPAQIRRVLANLTAARIIVPI